jgi:adenosylhomocysteine nucleosidase
MPIPGPISYPVGQLSLNEPCLLFALRRESQAFLREFRPQERFPGAPCLARFCGPEWLTVLVLETGIGRDRTERVLQWLLNKPIFGNLAYQPKVIISAGFAGALQEGLQVGDLILATEVTDGQGNLWPVSWPGPLPPGDWRPPLRRGRLLTANHLVAQPEEKRALGRQHEALAVDMESAVLAELCSRKEVPFACLRAISDPADATLSPRLVSLLSDGRISFPRLITALLSSLRLAGDFWRLRKATRVAGENLGKGLGELLTLTLPWNADS